MGELDKSAIEKMVREIIKETLLGIGNDSNKHRDPSGITSVKLKDITLNENDRFNTGKEGDRVYLRDMYSIEESPRLGCGLMEMKKTTFDWTLMYDEIDYIIDGTLEINIDGRKVSGSAGDIILIPNGSKIQFCVPDYAKFMYVTYPADWAEQNK